MSSLPFVRQLGAQPGVQLNPLQDATDGAAPDNADQVLAAVARLTRGHIDRPIRVHRGNLLAKTGPAVSIRENALNEAKIQVHEALNNGAVEAVLMRLVPAGAVKRYVSVALVA
jgi:hypothetical protein